MAKSQFPGTLKGEFVGKGKGRWKLSKPFQYYSSSYGNIIAPEGFITDGASIPRFAQIIVGTPWGGKYAEGSVIHDYLYRETLFSQKICDQIFLEAMVCKRVSLWKRQVIYRSLRVGGWVSYNKNLKKKKEKKKCSKKR